MKHEAKGDAQQWHLLLWEGEKQGVSNSTANYGIFGRFYAF